MITHDKCRPAEVVPIFQVEITDPDAETTCIRYAGESRTSESGRKEFAEAVIMRTLADGGQGVMKTGYSRSVQGGEHFGAYRQYGLARTCYEITHCQESAGQEDGVQPSRAGLIR